MTTNSHHIIVTHQNDSKPRQQQAMTTEAGEGTTGAAGERNDDMVDTRLSRLSRYVFFHFFFSTKWLFTITATTMTMDGHHIIVTHQNDRFDNKPRQQRAMTTATCHVNNAPRQWQRGMTTYHNDDKHDNDDRAWGSRRKHVSSPMYVFSFSFFFSVLILFVVLIDYVYGSR